VLPELWDIGKRIARIGSTVQEKCEQDSQGSTFAVGRRHWLRGMSDLTQMGLGLGFSQLVLQARLGLGLVEGVRTNGVWG
jgi:hypothetical protein